MRLPGKVSRVSTGCTINFSPNPTSMATMIERGMFVAPPERPKNKSENELAAEHLEQQEKDALLQWADILDIARKSGIDLENALDSGESEPAYKFLKEKLLELKDETLQILFYLDNEKEKLRRKGVTFEIEA